MRFWWPFLTLLVTTTLVHGLTPNVAWKTFGRAEGLSSSSVTGIVQDEQGFLWISTQNGLDRWDGYTMRVWLKEPFESNSLSHNVIQTEYLDGQSTLWLGTYGGLDRLNLKTETITSFQPSADQIDSLSHNVVTRIYRDRGGVLWVGTLDGLNRMQESSGTFVRYYPSPLGGGQPENTIRSFLEDSRGRLWVGTSGGLFLYDKQLDRLVAYSTVFPQTQLPPGAVMGLLKLNNSSLIWLGVWGVGLVRIDETSGETKTFSLADNRIFDLNTGEKGEIHVGTWGGGLIVFHPNTGSSFRFLHNPQKPSSLANDVVYGTFQDRTGLVWVKTNGGGLSVYNPLLRQFPSIPTGGKVTVLFQSRDQKCWAGVYNRGLVLWGPEGIEKVWPHRPEDAASLSSNIVNSIDEDEKGQLWIGTNNGIDVFNPRTGKFRALAKHPLNYEILPDEIITAIKFDRSRNCWVGTYRSGLIRTSDLGKRLNQHHYVADGNNAHSLPNNQIYFVKEDRQGRIWVGTNGGLALYRPQTDDFEVWTYHANDPLSLPGNTIRDLYEDAQGEIWVAVNGGGLARLDPSSGCFTNYGLKEGLGSLSLFSILQDHSGLLWIASANGLYSFQPHYETFHRYDTQDGLDEPEFSWGSVGLKNGQLVFGALEQIISLEPSHLQTETSLPTIAITGLQVLGKPRLVTNHLKLGWRENVFTLEFSVLDYRSPEKNVYAYQLQGFDKEWVNSGNRHSATYTNLWPGTYHFRYRGSSTNDHWSQSQHDLTIDIGPAPWLAWYALLGYLALIIVTIYLIQKARVSSFLRQKVIELEGLRTQLLEANRRLDQLARLDGLTEIPNRRAMEDWAHEEWALCLRQKQSLAVLMIDIDEFKRYNDDYGHLAGDECLKRVAKVLASNLPRTTDLCARYGGEEFSVLLHDTERDGAVTVAQRLLEAVDDLQIEHRTASACSTVSVSIGVTAGVPRSELTLDDFFRKADLALYRAKALGRHHVESAE